VAAVRLLRRVYVRLPPAGRRWMRVVGLACVLLLAGAVTTIAGALGSPNHAGRFERSDLTMFIGIALGVGGAALLFYAIHEVRRQIRLHRERAAARRGRRV
jgi:TRAP-type C4-dicarboxylate transport system permease small subunit